jgi:prepilin-type N-terminal cleavage/methylation domain-containing protein
MSQDKDSGFSLPEIIVVLLVIAIIAVLAIPQMSASIELNRVNVGSSMVAAMLSEAKMTAIKRNFPVTFVLDETNGSVWIEANSIIIGNVQKIPQATKIKINPDATTAQERITFNSIGSLTTPPATISVFNAQKKVEKKVSINLTGRISVAEMNTY